jgi:hypothetical protein
LPPTWQRVAEKFFVRVDVTEEFPFLVTKLSAYSDCQGCSNNY